MKKVLVINGPNLNLLGEREPRIYGSETLAELNEALAVYCQKMNMDMRSFQSNHEGEIIDVMHANRKWANGIVLNPGALTHYSYALRDAIASVNLPTIEVHLSDIMKREEFRKHSVVEDVCAERFIGLGRDGYFRAVEFLAGLGVLKKLKEFMASGKDKDAVLKKTVRLLKESFPKYTWVGIYLKDGEELVLHNFIGKPTPHERIPVGNGICGAAASEKQSIIVDDVDADSRYLACSVETRSEIVVPIMSEVDVFGEIDIDSDHKAIFHEGDRKMLEECSRLLLDVF